MMESEDYQMINIRIAEDESEDCQRIITRITDDFSEDYQRMITRNCQKTCSDDFQMMVRRWFLSDFIWTFLSDFTRIQMKKIPLWIQDFKKLITEGYLYVDKTEEIIKLVDQNQYYFLPRPRRFWKSLLCSTMKYMFLVEKELFTWLYAEKNWDWEQWYPVVYISFAWWWSQDEIKSYIQTYGEVFIKEKWQIKSYKIEERYIFLEKSKSYFTVWIRCKNKGYIKNIWSA